MDQREYAESLLRNAERELDRPVEPSTNFISQKWAAAKTEYKILYIFVTAFLFICFVFIPAVVFGPSLISSISVGVGLTKEYEWTDVTSIHTGMKEQAVYGHLGWPSESEKKEWASGKSGKEMKWKPRGDIGEVYVEVRDGKVIEFRAQRTTEGGMTQTVEGGSRGP